MVGKQFAFVQALPLGRSKREQELEQAKARSHAAKVVHRRIRDAEQGYQQSVLAAAKEREFETREYLLGKHGGTHTLREAIESFAATSADRFTNHLADNHQTQPEATSLSLGSQEVVVQRWSTRSAPALIPPYLSLRQGNSDPFSAFAIPINSRINALMMYTREYYLPAISTDATNPESVIRPEDWQECVSLLGDACTAYAHLARVAAFMSQPGHGNKSNELARQALVFNGKGTLLLRKRIEKGVVDHNTLYVMSCFLAAEYYCRNFTAARSHAKMLGQLFPRDDAPVDYSLLLSVLRLDSILALRSLTRPSFDVEKWVPEVFARHHKPLLKMLPESISLGAMSIGLDESLIDDPKLQDVIVRLRQVLVLYLLSFGDPTFAVYEFKVFVRYVVYVSLARLVHHYLDAELLYADQATVDSVITGRAQVQAYTSLAAILWVRWVATGKNYTADGDMDVTNELLMDRLKEKMTDSEWMVSKNAQGLYTCARLWALYVGAYLEQAQIAGPASPESISKDWFNVRLAQQAKAMGLVSWEQVHERLLRFLHADVLQPHGSTWFLKTMEANV